MSSTEQGLCGGRLSPGEATARPAIEKACFFKVTLCMRSNTRWDDFVKLNDVMEGETHACTAARRTADTGVESSWSAMAP
ncbi:hypothetical protein U9M48_005091 [Paspalum notatum var. saurae]|uniref:Uncharacterized protein n=1 Tax=Paspalum notatum var. saurae TaxID=547442 RepID=A0AAQ3PQ33_PASNO